MTDRPAGGRRGGAEMVIGHELQAQDSRTASVQPQFTNCGAWQEFGSALCCLMTLRQRGEAIDHLVPTGQVHLRLGANSVWLEPGAPS